MGGGAVGLVERVELQGWLDEVDDGQGLGSCWVVSSSWGWGSSCSWGWGSFSSWGSVSLGSSCCWGSFSMGRGFSFCCLSLGSS